jgi:hypothetical protein
VTIEITMGGSVLKVTVTGSDAIAVRNTLNRLQELAADESTAVEVAQTPVPDVAACHLVIGVHT